MRLTSVSRWCVVPQQLKQSVTFTVWASHIHSWPAFRHIYFRHISCLLNCLLTHVMLLCLSKIKQLIAVFPHHFCVICFVKSKSLCSRQEEKKTNSDQKSVHSSFLAECQNAQFPDSYTIISQASLSSWSWSCQQLDALVWASDCPPTDESWILSGRRSLTIYFPVFCCLDNLMNSEFIGPSVSWSRFQVTGLFLL